EVVKPITFAGNSGTVDRKLGETLNITGGLTGAGSNSNIKTVITGNTVDIQLADAPVFAGKVTANGLDANGNKVENVADATAATDAVNKGQLDATQANVDKGIKFGNGTSNNQFALGDTINVKGSTDGSITSTTTADGVQLGLGNTIKVGTANPITIDGTAGTIGGLSNKTWNGTAVSGQAATEDQLAAVDSKLGGLDDAAVKYDNATTKDKITLAGAGGTTITNVKVGDISSAASTDAVNGGQLFTTNQNVTTAQNAADAAQATADKGIKFGNGTSNNQFALGDTINVKGSTDGSITSTTTADGVQLGLGNTIKVGTANPITIDGTAGTIGGLSNKTWNGTAVSGQAATEDQLAAVDSKLGSLDDAAVKYDNATTKDKITLAGAGGTTITNVKAGAVNASSTDAVNGSQLFNTANNVKNLVGGATTIDATTGGITTSNIGGTGSNTIDGAITSVKDAATKAKTTVTAGDNVVVTPTTNADGSSNYQVSTAKDVSFDKVTVGSVVVDKATNTIKGLSNTTWNGTAVSGQAATEDQLAAVDGKLGTLDDAAVKYDDATTKDKITLAGVGGTTITNVKAGAVNASSTDAVNGSQLFNTANNVKNLVGGATTIDATTGAITTSNIGGTGSNTIDGAITSVKDAATKAKTTVTAGDNVVVTPTTNADGSSDYQVSTAKDVNFDKVTVGSVVVDKASNTIEGLSNTDIKASDFATKGRAATEEQLKSAITSNITEVVDGNGNKVNIVDQVVNKNPDNKNQDSLFLTYDKQGQETTDRLTIGQTVQKMNTDGIKFFHTNADTSKGDLGTTNDSSAGGLNSTAIGVNAIVTTGADSAVALGHNSKAGGKESIAIGQGAEATGLQSISIGTGNKVKGDHSGAIGDPTIVDGANSYSVGNNNQVLTDDTFVLGNNVTKTVAGSVVLGNGSAATTGAGVAGYALSAATGADKAAITKTTSTTGAVAVGDEASGIYRQITGVAAGSADADAVNVAQLKAVGNQVVTTQTALVNSLGGGAKVNADGTITGPTYNVAQANQTNVGDALTALDKAIGSAATTSKTTVTNGQNIVVNKSKNADGSDNYEVATAKDLTVDSVKAGDTVLNNAGITIGNNAVVLSNTGLTIAGGPSVTTQGINAGNKQVTNVAAGVNATDAVNKGQLDSAISNVNNTVNELANNAVKYDDATKDKITLGGGANGTTITNVKDGNVAQGSKDAVNGGQVAQIRDNLQGQITNNTNDINNIKNDINNGAVGLVKQANSSAEVTVAKDTGGTSVNVAGKDGDRVVTGVKDGAISATSKDAINGSQLNATNKKVVEFLGGGAGYDNITNSFTNPTYNVGGKDYNNVGGAVDALNKADQALGSRIDNLDNKLEQAFYSTNQRIEDVEKKANAGIAAAMALEAAPYVAGKYTYAAGASYHGGENAVGVTLRKTADNGRWSITGGVAAASQGDPSVRIGISGVID
ncbi:YadA-like family protein, partial [Acinetobacter proteolyticus]|uniref:YadA-like family protein n=1 Tax=Acinetobacter proteolyticus TaxID=1776741 RepID=UPI0031DD8FD3